MSILQTMTTISKALAEAESLTRIERGARDFVAVAHALMASRALNMSWASYADSVRLSPKSRCCCRFSCSYSWLATGTGGAQFLPMYYIGLLK